MCVKQLAVVLLIIVNFVFAAAGLLMLACGVIALVKSESLVEIFNYVPELTEHTSKAGFNLQSTVEDSAIFMIVLGGVVGGVGVLGCAGACLKVQCMLSAYIVILVLILLAEIALIIFAALFPTTSKEKIQQAMNKTLSKYQDDGQRNATTYVMPTSEIELAWASMQFALGCCGTYDYTDYAHSNLTSSQKVPVSCCTLTAGPGSIPTDKSGFVNLQKCLQGDKEYINSQNCFDAVENLLVKSARIAIGIAAAIIGVEIILILLTAWIRRSLDRDKSMSL